MNESTILGADLFELADRLLDAYPDLISFEDFGPYRVCALIGKGGMGEVYLAEDQVAGRSVAIKFLSARWRDPESRQRFSCEVKTLARLEHPFIARLYDAGVHPNGTPYFAMEYVQGKALDRYCSERNSTLEQRLRLFRSACEAVQYAHSHLVIHRDLKPSNILVTEDGTPKLLDFGIAKQMDSATEPVEQTQTEIRFTRAFAAPEQIRREPVGVYTDVYALGVILYQLLAGKLPYDLEDCGTGGGEGKITGDGEPERPSKSGTRVNARRAAWTDLDVLCLTAMKKDVSRRYASVVELIQDIDHYLNGEPLKARPDSLGYRFSKFVRRRRRTIAIASIVAVLFTAMAVAFTLRLAAERNAAVREQARLQVIQRLMLNMLGAGDRRAPPSNDLKVLTLLDRASQDAKRLRGDPSTQAQLHETLGRMYRMLGQTSDAEAHLQAAFDLLAVSPNVNRAEMAGVLSEIGILRGDESKFPEARRAVEKALDLLRGASAQNDPVLYRAMVAQARVSAQSGSYAKAIALLQPLLKINPPGPESDFLRADALYVLGYAQNGIGNYQQAKLIGYRQLELDRKLYGESHALVGFHLANLASVETTQGQYAKAEAMYRSAITILSNWYGEGHREVLKQTTSLAALLVQEGRPAEARPLLKRVVALEQASANERDPDLAWALDSIGRLELKTGDQRQAEQYFVHALKIDEAVFGDKEHRTAMVKAHLGQAYLKEARYSDAARLFDEALLGLPSKNSGNMSVPVIEVLLGQVQVRLKRFHEAEAHLLSGYRLLAQERKQPLLKSRDMALANLAVLYTASGQSEKAAEYKNLMVTHDDLILH